MSDDVRQALSKLQKAVNKLALGVEEARGDLEKDGVIQRFEFTFELLWKTLKLYLESQGILTRTPRETLQSAFRVELIPPEDEEAVLEMLEDRNKMSHTYDEEAALEIYKNVAGTYLPVMKRLLSRLESRIGGEAS